MNFNKKSFFLSLSLIGILILLCCTEVINVETETPPGFVPPPNPTVSPAQIERNISKTPNKKITLNPQSQQLSQNMESSNVNLSQFFKNSYIEKGSPRIIVFFNKELSAEVREWKKESQIRIITREIKNLKESENPSVSKDILKDTSIGKEVQNISNSRVYPGEKWMWAFEDGFIQPLLEVGVNIIDYNTILRLRAGDNAKIARNDDLSNLKFLEIDAIRSFSDILIEILVLQDDSSPLGYSFKVTAKNVKTGGLLAYSVLLDWDSSSFYQRKNIVATEKGYVIEEEFPTVEMMAEQLAFEIMEKLVQYWSFDS